MYELYLNPEDDLESLEAVLMFAEAHGWVDQMTRQVETMATC
jgi:hypothetical protein